MRRGATSAEGYSLYLDTVDPVAAADVVIDNNDLGAPLITRDDGP